MNPALILFTKKPISGQVKTRLAKVCGDEKAAEIAKYLIKQTVYKAVSAWPGQIIFCVWPDTEHALFEALAEEYSIRLQPQSEGDLGVKMRVSLNNAVREFGAAAVMGCDIPGISAALLQEAYQSLEGGEHVIGPSLDGGYYLIGFSGKAADVFSAIDWGGAQVYRQTLEIAARKKIQFHTLPTLQDLDTWVDLQILARDNTDLKPFLD